uniref:dCMP deaminase n=1 Tax=Cyprinus carpio carpio TaxID=630221 RepID=A0A9J8CUH9_CYPCA
MDHSAKNGTSQLNGTHGEGLTKKRQDYLEWPEYFMAVAFLSAQRSKDPSSQVGACIVNQENKIVGIGYNGMPNGCDDDLLPWSRSADNKLDTKYPYVCHAELNAIMNKNSADVKGCTMYVALFPCNECAKLIIQAGSAFLLRYLSLCASADVAADEMTDETGGNRSSRWSPFHTEKPAVGVTLSSRLLCEPSWLVRFSLHGDRLSSSYFSFSKPCSAVIFNLFLSVELS